MSFSGKYKSSVVANYAERGNITIVASGELIKSISLIDLAGKELQIVNNQNSTKIEFTLSDVATGLYHLRITSNTGISKIFKLVKQ